MSVYFIGEWVSWYLPHARRPRRKRIARGKTMAGCQNEGIVGAWADSIPYNASRR